MQAGVKETQRDRLIAATIAASNRGGLQSASISAVIAEARVSRPTFYEYFKNREQCLLAATTHTQEHALTAIREAVGEQPRRAAHAACGALLAFATEQPALAMFLMHETLGGGPRMLDLRDQGIDAAAQIINDAQRASAGATRIPAMAPAVMVGGICRWLGARLRRGEREFTAHREQLDRWIGRYEQPEGQRRWRTLEDATEDHGESPFVADTRMRPPSPMAPGRPRLAPEEVAENHRLRIMHAAAELAAEKGYAATTIAEITRRARVDGRVFYAQFPTKQDAFMAVHELGFQELMAVTAGAFFAGASWPERSWQAARALTQFLEQHPTLTHIGFVEAYAVGRAAAQRVEDSHVAFAIFLREGVQRDPEGDPPSEVELEAIITTIFELIYRQARKDPAPNISSLLARVIHLWLTPLRGAADTNTFVDAKLKRERAGRHGGRKRRRTQS